MNLLITGGSGFLGTHLVEHAVSAGYRVKALVRTTSKVDFLERLGVEFVRGDLKNPQSLRDAVAGMEGIIHAASSMDGIPLETEAATIKGTADLLLAAEQAGVRRFVHISSIGIYATHSESPGQLVNEDCSLEQDARFVTDYVRSKIASEAAALKVAARGKMQVVVLRPGILYGPRGLWALPRTGYSFGSRLYVLVGSGQNELPVCYVENCAEAALLALTKLGLPNGALFNIVDDETFTQTEFFERLKREAFPHLRILKAPYYPFYASAFVGERLGKRFGVPFPFRTAHIFLCGHQRRYSNERAKVMLGWRPQIGKIEALSRTMKFYADRTRISRAANLRVLQQARVVDPPMGICVIGCGVIAEEHLNILKGIQGIRITAVCDPNPEAASKIASKYSGLRTYDDPDRMLAQERPQAVHIVTPPQTHASLTRTALRSGCHVLVEKPMAVNAQEAYEMADMAEKSGLKLCVDHNHVYDPVVVQARRMVQSGDVGEILWVESYYGFNLGSNPDNRYMLPGGEKHWTFQLPGGLYQNLASHPLSLALDLLGKPTKIYAHARYGRVLPHASTDELRMIMETPKASGMAVVSLAACPRAQFVNIYGTKMTLCVDVLNKWIIVQGVIKGLPKPLSRAVMDLRHGATVLAGTVSGVVKVLRGKWTYCDGMELLIREFYSSILENREAPVAPQQGVWTMEIMDEVWEQIGMYSARETALTAGTP